MLLWLQNLHSTVVSLWPLPPPHSQIGTPDSSSSDEALLFSAYLKGFFDGVEISQAWVDPWTRQCACGSCRFRSALWENIARCVQGASVSDIAFIKVGLRSWADVCISSRSTFSFFLTGCSSLSFIRQVLTRCSMLWVGLHILTGQAAQVQIRWAWGNFFGTHLTSMHFWIFFSTFNYKCCDRFATALCDFTRSFPKIILVRMMLTKNLDYYFSCKKNMRNKPTSPYGDDRQ